MNDLVKNQQKKLLNGHGKGRSHRKFSQFGNMYFGHYELKEVQNPSNSFIHQKNKKVVICMADFLDIGHYYTQNVCTTFNLFLIFNVCTRFQVQFFNLLEVFANSL